jgi:thiopeptide-type bacteriocin biosynthesis protein
MRLGYRPASRFVLRTPLLPFDHGRALAELVTDPVVREALWLASPELEASIEAWRAAPASPRGLAIGRSLARYIVRMSGRATPFALFGGVSIGTFGAETRLEVAPRTEYRRAARFDLEYLAEACAALARELRAHLPHAVNTSLYELGDRLRYVEARIAGGDRSHHLVELERAPALDTLLARAQDGATPGELVDALCADPEVARADAEAFVDEVIDAQVLVPQLAPPVTAAEPVASVIAVLERAGGAAAAAALADARAQIASIESAPLGAPRATYEAVATTLSALSASGQPVQVDLVKPARATLGPQVVGELVRMIELVHAVGMSQSDPWPAFCAAFEARFGTREVPLVEVLDEESGIGFGETPPATSALLGELGIPAAPAAPPRIAWTPRDVALVRLATSGAREIELTDDDVAQLTDPRAPVAADVVLAAAVLGAASGSAVDAGEFVLRLVGIAAPGPRPLARLCAASPEIGELVGELVRAERAANPDAVLAEVVHLPEGRMANIVWRPVLRDYEIAYLGASGAPRDAQLAIGDLVVAIDRGRVVLRSRRLGREIIPRLSSAHDATRRSLAVYRFLSALESQGQRPGVWSWGVLDDARFLPRVRRGRIVLSRARWLLDGGELRALRDEVTRPAALASLRTTRGLPRWIVLADEDRELPVDLDDAAAADMFADHVKSRPGAVVYELFPGPDALVAHGPEGRFVHELVVPFVRSEVHAPAAARVDDGGVARRFAPGSRWLYAKLYGGAAGADRVLRDVIAPLVTPGEPWFFLRHDDPDAHLRVRWHGDHEPRIRELRARLADAGEPCWRVAFDTYEREVERYGGARGIELAEQVFAADSDAVLAILADDPDDERRWLLALRGIDRLLDDLGIADKHQLVTIARDGYAAELGTSTAHLRRLGDKFRADKAAIEQALASDAFAARSERIRPLAPELHACARPVEELARSFVHMHVNRLLPVAQRAHELVLLDFLRRHYASR